MKYQVWQEVENAWGIDHEVIFETNDLKEAKKVIDEEVNGFWKMDPDLFWIEDNNGNVID